MMGEFTYDTYLEHLIEREARTRAELQGFRDAKDFPHPVCYSLHGLQDSYEVGFHIGRFYLKEEDKL